MPKRVEWLELVGGVCMLREIDLNTEETAAVPGTGERAVKVRLHQPGMRLRELLATYLDV